MGGYSQTGFAAYILLGFNKRSMKPNTILVLCAASALAACSTVSTPWNKTSQVSKAFDIPSESCLNEAYEPPMVGEEPIGPHEIIFYEEFDPIDEMLAPTIESLEKDLEERNKTDEDDTQSDKDAPSGYVEGETAYA